MRTLTSSAPYTGQRIYTQLCFPNHAICLSESSISYRIRCLHSFAVHNSQKKYSYKGKVMPQKDYTAALGKVRELYKANNILIVRNLGGFSSDNIQVNMDGKSYVLKAYHNKKPQEVDRIEKLTQFLAENKFPVFNPVLTCEGKTHFVFEDKVLSLFPMIEGVVLHEPSLNPEILAQIAHLFASFHRLDGSSLSLNSSLMIPISRKKIKADALKALSLITSTSLGHGTDKLAKDLIDCKMSTLDMMTGSDLFKPLADHQHLVHGDFHNQNILFDDKFNIVRLLDFEHVHYGHRIEDVMHFILLACCASGFNETNLTKARSFLCSYQTNFPLRQDEISLGLRYAIFKECSSFFLETNLYQGGDPFLIKLLKRDLKKIEYFNEHFESFLKQILP